MKNSFILTALFVWFYGSMIAQHQEDSFYATMSLSDAKELKKKHPSEINIISKKRNEAAVLLTDLGGHLLHEQILVHGPGYIYATSEDEAIKAIQQSYIQKVKNVADYTITEDATVQKVLPIINVDSITNHIKELEAFGNRYHTSPSGKQSALDLKIKWEQIAAAYNRDDVSVRLYDHERTPMPSVIMTIEGTELPDQIVVVGGHLDSTSRHLTDRDDPNSRIAPGADDDASGIATITESARALFEIGFKPKRTIEIMAYAAEEIGLVGSKEIASAYDAQNKNVIAVGQFDMTLYNGSAKDIHFVEDKGVTDVELTDFFESLLDYYNSEGAHKITYGFTSCGYGCSDHHSWGTQGFRAAFPFEANFSNSNNNIHTKNDTFSLIGTANHAVKFAKLCSEFLIEVAKDSRKTLATPSYEKDNYTVFVQNKVLSYELDQSLKVEQLQIFDVNGKLVFSSQLTDNNGTMSLTDLVTGVYVVSIKLTSENTITKKIVL
ncbi:M20/M25/M40 family metallo-hydrolase [Aquimarina sp. ERC-38]|uniref:M20/M25/M40 family metallo-hydrolase n=1 Tax=Aquimarina sp. ERC-38 TaxID=2949996 RepID=UPI0022482049|nr:M20/M25/M40 family metallo-hydrolase [Aquimarina sp. ERC-38]UZO80866.1 M20/M25/M40 family metallo-hydrolase [Aquimarina sp. ERC-38]